MLVEELSRIAEERKELQRDYNEKKTELEAIKKQLNSVYSIIRERMEEMENEKRGADNVK